MIIAAFLEHCSKYCLMKTPPFLRILWHCVPFIAIGCFLYLTYYDLWIGAFFITIFWWLVLPLIIWAVHSLRRSWRIGGIHKYIIASLFTIEVVTVLLLLLVIVPSKICSPKIMATHYEKNKGEMEKLISFTHSAIDDGQELGLEFEQDTLCRFHITNTTYWFEAEKRKKEIMSKVGLDDNEFNSIKNQLKTINCISIDTHFPEYCEIGYKRVGLNGYYYRFYLIPMREEQIQSALSDPHLIPYNDRVLFVYLGGALDGPDTFSPKVKKRFLKHHSKLQYSTSY